MVAGYAKPKMPGGGTAGQPKDRLKMLRDQIDGNAPPAGSATTPVGPAPGSVQQQPTPGYVTPAPGAGANGVTDISGQVGGGKPPGNTNVAGPGQAGTPMPGYTPPAPGSSGRGDFMDSQIEQFIRSMLEGANNVDTSEQEALIRELEGQATGQHLMNSAAAAGASGFAQSGAQLAMEGDIRQQGARRTSEQILDVRERERQRAIDNALAGIGVDLDLREHATDEGLIEAIIAQLGIDPDDPVDPGAGDGSGEDAAVAAGAALNKGAEIESSYLQGDFESALEHAFARPIDTGAVPDTPEARAAAQEVEFGEVPEGAQDFATDGAYTYYSDGQGNYWKVRHATASGDY